MTPLITVTIPVYNCEKYVRRAAESVLNQPHAEQLELILVDDGSTDNSGAVCDAIAEENDNVRVVHKENGGVSSARNLGIDMANGEYLAFLDADDWWIKEFLNEEVLCVLKRGFEVIQFAYMAISTDYRFIKEHHVIEEEQFYSSPSTKRKSDAAHWSYFYARSLIKRERIEYPKTKRWEDALFVQYSVYLAKSIKRMDNFLLFYWMNPDSYMHTANREELLEETIRAMTLEPVFLKKHGIEYNNEESILSCILESLPFLCSKYGYMSFVQFTLKPMYTLLYQDKVQPWTKLRKRFRFWQKHPFMFWLCSQVYPGLFQRIRRLIMRWSKTHRLTSFLQYRVCFRWAKASIITYSFLADSILI